MDETNLSRTIRKYVRAWELPPEQINDGFCGEFSCMVLEALGGETDSLYESFTEAASPGHCWITYLDRHYDAECPDGVESADALPFFQRQNFREKSLRMG